MEWRKSLELYGEAQKLFPGGVNSPARKLIPYPFYVREATGPYIVTVDDVKLIDYCMAFGALVLGHRPYTVLNAIVRQLEKGWIYGMPYELEIEMARKIISHYPSIEMIRFVNSGTEATMNAIRLARAFTRRNKIIKFEGCYHGSHDYVLVKAGSGALTWSIPTSKGIPEDVIKNTIVLPYNDLESLEKTMRKHGDDIAAIIVEPVVVNAGLILPKDDFLKGIRELTKTYGSLLIFDEVATGYRLGLSGAQGYYNVIPDITTLGKIIGGGFPIGAFGAKREIMELVSPSGPVYNAGTFNAHPMSMAAGLATIEELEKGYPYKIANNAAKVLTEVIEDSIRKYKINARVYRIGSMFQIFFVDKDVINYDIAKRSDTKKYYQFHLEALKRGVFLTPSQFETNFTSSAHTDEVLSKSIEALKEALRAIAG